MTDDEFLQGLKCLTDKWCERRALRPLYRFLGGYFALNGLTDSHADLEVALKDVLAFAKAHITEEESSEIKRLLVFTHAIVYREQTSLGQSPRHLIKPTQPIMLTVLMCRSLLAGDSEGTLAERVRTRLQAGSYIRSKPKRASEYRTRTE